MMSADQTGGGQGGKMKALRVEKRPDGVALVIFDDPQKPVNTLSVDLLAEVQETLKPLLSDDEVKALVLASGKPDSFIAGADLKALEQAQTAQEAARLSREGNRLLSELAASPKPVVAAIHGAALGGGLEAALACHYILASDDPVTVLGQVEVMVGLLPAGGGTQRLIKRTGLIKGLPLLLTGKRIRARQALRLGLVDALTTAGGIRDTGVRAALDLAAGKLKRRRPKRSLFEKLTILPPLRNQVLKKARQQVAAKTRGHYPAPPAIIDCVETGLKKGITAGLELESKHFGELAMSPQSRSLVWLFHAMNRLKKMPLPAEPREVGRLAVLGGGFMGAGIASVSLGRGPVLVRDISAQALARAAEQVRGGLEKQLRSGAIRKLERDRRWSRLWLTTSAQDLAGADLVIEAVFEDLELKRRVLAECEELLAPQAVFASNTSALPIGQIAAKARHPERVVGMHYFSPVPKMPLLELVVPAAAAEEAVATAAALGRAQGKTVILVKDSPGFYTSRILAPFLNEAMVLLAEGVRIENLDRAAKDFGFPVGPLTLLDEVGIDVAAHVSKDLGPMFAQRGAQPSGALGQISEAGYQGRKSGRGFYRYRPGRKKGRKRPNQEIYSFFGPGPRKDLPLPEIQERLALMMINEAALCLQEEVIDSPASGDVGAILGLGFPPFRGGPFHYLDAQGTAAVVERMERMAAKHGPRFSPAQLLKDRAHSGQKFYA